MEEKPSREYQQIANAAAKRGDPSELVTLSFVLELLEHYGDKVGLLTYACERFPTHPEVRLAQADVLANARQWSQVRALCSGLDPAAFDEGRAQHIHHLMAIALLHLDEPEEARRALDRGRAVSGGGCDLSLLVALATPLGEGPSGEAGGAWTPEQAAVRALVSAVSLADACLSRGDAAGVRVALDQPLVWEAREVQSLARLAEAHLCDEPEGARGRFRKALALAAFQGAHTERRTFCRHEMPFPHGRWDTARLDALSDRAGAWLSEAFGAPVK
jgi:hypothetical protein